MDAAVALILALLAIPHGLNSHYQLDEATALRMQQREKFLHQEKARLLQEIEQIESAQEATLLSILQRWPMSTIALALVLLAAVCRLAWEVLLYRFSDQDSSSSEEEEKEEEEDLSDSHNAVTPLALSTPLPTQGLPDECKVLKQLVGDLLGVSQVLSKRAFMPQMHPAIEMDTTNEGWSFQENSISYRLLVFLRPPPGHSFIPELDTTGQVPSRPSSIRVVLECTCLRDKTLGESSCFHHHPDDKLPKDQRSFVLRTLCTHSYLDTKKVTCWILFLLRLAWLFLPVSRYCQLTVLSSSQCCILQLTSPSELNMCVELIFALEEAAQAPT